MTNPWDLNPTRMKIMQTICAKGSDKLAAKELGLSHRTVETYMRDIRSRMHADNRVLAILTFDRWARG